MALNDFTTSEENTTPETCVVNVFTRLHQASTISSFILPIVLIGLCTLVLRNTPVPQSFANTVYIAVGLIGISPVFIAFIGFPATDTATLTPEGLTFTRHRPIAFADIRSFEADSYLKIKLKSRKLTIMVAGKIGYSDAYPAFRNAFLTALDQWAQTHPAQDMPRQTSFLGSIEARLMGAFATLCSVAFFVLLFSTGNLNLLGYGIIALLFGLPLLLIGRSR